MKGSEVINVRGAYPQPSIWMVCVLLRFALVALLLVGCTTQPRRPSGNSTLPRWAEPQGEVMDPAKLDRSDVIAYRSLVRADFKGTHPPKQFAQFVDRMGAVTCAYIAAPPDLQVKLEPERSAGGPVVYRATPIDLRFTAQMDRNCSWWNSERGGLSDRYLLEHEQIHFALFEIEARMMNESLWELEARLEAPAESAEAAAEIAQREIEAHLQAGLAEVLAVSTEFDRDTSVGEHTAEQAKWWKLVQGQLAASAAD